MVVVDGSDVVDVVVVVVQLALLRVLHLRFVYVSRCCFRHGFASVCGCIRTVVRELNWLNGSVTTVAAMFGLPDLNLLAVPVVVLVTGSEFRSWFQSCTPFPHENST